jgi:bacterioferritin-associated ferredoxin
MYICICAGITEKELKQIVTSNITLDYIQEQGICDDCCKCKTDIERVIEEVCQESLIPISE